MITESQKEPFMSTHRFPTDNGVYLSGFCFSFIAPREVELDILCMRDHFTIEEKMGHDSENEK